MNTTAWNPVRAIHQAGMTVLLADIDFFAVSYTDSTITLGSTLSAAERRCALAVALAHVKLGHRGNTTEQEAAAYSMAEWWLNPDDQAVLADDTRWQYA